LFSFFFNVESEKNRYNRFLFKKLALANEFVNKFEENAQLLTRPAHVLPLTSILYLAILRYIAKYIFVFFYSHINTNIFENI